MESIITSHNKKLTFKPNTNILPCNCRDKQTCPLDGKCRSKNIIYKCAVSTTNKPTKVYMDLTENEWKKRYNNHKQSFSNKKYAKSTALSSYIWEVKDKQQTPPTLTWSIMKSVSAYSNLTKRCRLCLYEKFAIINYPNEHELLNKRSELISKCRHENKFLLINYSSND